ncbi:MAG: VOC family protein [Micropepsaceae bacterium]
MSKPASPPEGIGLLSPHLVCAGAAEAIEFYKRAFDAVEMMRLPGENGKLMHASVLINGASVMLVDEAPAHGMLGPKSLKGTPVSLHLKVADVDKAFAQAVAAGATVIMPVADMFWGDRYGQIEDPFGHRWSLATPKKNLSQAEIGAASRAAMPGYVKA